MKHSKRESSSRGHKGFSKSPKDNLSISHRLGPIIIEDILARATRMSKSDEVIREMEVRTEPLNEASPRIKRKFRPLDNPSSILEVLRVILARDQRRGSWQQCHHRTATVSILADLPRRNSVEQVQRVRPTGG
jgi:hypothetical protein